MLSFERLETAVDTLAAIEWMRRIYKRQINRRILYLEEATVAEIMKVMISE
jgi:hypothetical protein